LSSEKHFVDKIYDVQGRLVEGYCDQSADERHGKPPQGNQELLVAKDKVGRPQVSLG